MMRQRQLSDLPLEVLTQILTYAAYGPGQEVDRGLVRTAFLDHMVSVRPHLVNPLSARPAFSPHRLATPANGPQHTLSHPAHLLRLARVCRRWRSIGKSSMELHGWHTTD